MSKFVLVHIGFEQPTPEVMEAWGDWFDSIEDVTVENVGLGPALEVSAEGVRELPFDRSAVTGYSVIEVESQEAAVEIAQRCPFITGVGVYEVR
jgi:hypothetical protein